MSIVDPLRELLMRGYRTNAVPQSIDPEKPWRPDPLLEILSQDRDVRFIQVWTRADLGSHEPVNGIRELARLLMLPVTRGVIWVLPSHLYSYRGVASGMRLGQPLKTRASNTPRLATECLGGRREAVFSDSQSC